MENGINSIIVWGDSILKGVVSGENESKRFEIIENDSLTLANKSLNLEIINKSVFGSFLSKIQRTQLRDINKGLTVDACIIESGGNDSDYDWALVSQDPDAPHTTRCPLPDFERILLEMVNAARNANITPILMTAPPLVCPWWFKNICIGQNQAAIEKFVGSDIYSLYRRQELYSLKIAECARTNGVQLVDMRAAFLETSDYTQLICKDGIHPNLKGYEFMATVWEKELPKIKKEPLDK